jgi:hypothetical protein
MNADLDRSVADSRGGAYALRIHGSCRISSTISNMNIFEVLIIIWNPYYKPDTFIIITYVQWPYK